MVFNYLINNKLTIYPIIKFEVSLNKVNTIIAATSIPTNII